MLMSIGFVFGNMMKNLFCVPRPPATIVHRARPSDADDYSMPSTHSLQAVSLPLWFTVYMVFEFGYSSPLFFMIWIPLVIFWTLSVSWSRLYLGAHTPQDVVAGWILGAVLGSVYCLFYRRIERDLMAGNRETAFLLFAFAVLLVYLHPMEVFFNSSLSKWSIVISQSGYLTSCDLAGVIAGASIGLISIFPETVPISLSQNLFKGILRFTIGPLICAIVYFSSKKILRSILMVGYTACGIPLFDPPAKPTQIPTTLTLKSEGGKVVLESLNGHTFCNGPAPNLRRWTQTNLGLLLFGSGFQVMPIVKFLQYASLSWMVTAGCPFLFQFIGI